jgi:ABC-type glycerol-3-phosphate transport system substrate-binding protein
MQKENSHIMRIRATVPGTRSRRAAGAALIAALGLAASACAGGGTTSAASTTSGSPLPSVTGPVTITIADAYTATSSLGKTFAKVIAAFEAKNPDITVKSVPQANYGTLETKLKAEVAAGREPTIGQGYESFADQLEQSGKLVPISTLAGTKTPAELSTFYTGVQKDLYLPDGTLAMWPIGKSLQVIFYNSTMLSANGLSAAADWNTFATDLEASSKNGVTGITIDPSAQTSGEEWLEELAASYGTEAYASDGTPQFTSSAMVKALGYLQNLKTRGALATGTNYPGETALGGQKGLADISSSAGYYYENEAVGGKFKLTTTAVPQTDMMAGGNFFVFSSATAQQQAAAWDFLQFVTSPAEQAVWGAGTGYLPVTAQALTESAMSAYLTKNPWVSQIASGLNTAIVDPPQQWVDDCGTLLATALQAGLSGTNATSALNTAQTACLQKKQADS